MPRLALVILAALALAGCGRAPGVDPLAAGSGHDAFVALDVDANGRLAPAEAGLVTAAFAALDRDGDGALSFLEWNAGRNDADTAFRVQLRQETQRDTANEPHRNGSTIRGTN